MTTQLSVTHLSANVGRSLLALDQLVTFNVNATPTEKSFAELRTPVTPPAKLPMAGSPDMDRVTASFQKHQLESMDMVDVYPSR